MRIIQIKIDAALKKWAINHATVLFPFDNADAPNHFNRTFRTADFDELQDFVELLIQGDGATARQLLRRPHSPWSGDPRLDCRNDGGPVFNPEHQIEKGRRVQRLVTAARSLHDVVCADLPSSESNVPLDRSDGENALCPRLRTSGWVR